MREEKVVILDKTFPEETDEQNLYNTEKTSKPIEIKILSEDEINEDLNRKFTISRISLDDLLDEERTIIRLEKKNAIESYSYAYHIMGFINREEGRTSFVLNDTLPVAFILAPTTRVELFYYFVESGKGSKALDTLSGMEILGIGIPKDKRYKTTFRTYNFDTIKNGIADYISDKKGIEKEKTANRFDNQLGIFKKGINEVSEKSTFLYDKFFEWFNKKKKEERKGSPHKHLRKFLNEYKLKLKL